MLTNQHVEVDHKLVDMSTSSAESTPLGVREGRFLAGWCRILFEAVPIAASVRNAVQRDGREDAHGLGR